MDISNAKDYLPFVQALAEGKTIQLWKESDKTWNDIKYNICFDCEPKLYRIKPSEPKYRPFKDTKELIDYWQLHYNPGAANRPQYSKPIIWIRKSEDDTTYATDYMITGIDKNTVFIEDMWIEITELFERGYTFLDGKPLGVRE